MSAQTKLTQPEMVLLSLYRVSHGTTQKIPYEELVLQAWRDYPEAFSLRNYPEYPDGSDIHKKLYNGFLKTDSLVVSLGDKNFRLTEKGVTRASELLSSRDSAIKVSTVTNAARLSRDEQRFLDHALRSRPLQVWRTGISEKLTDYDARVFFQFSTGTDYDDRKLKVKAAQEAAGKAMQLNIVGAGDVYALISYLAEKFSSLFQAK